MPTKKELQDEAESRGLEVPSKATKQDIQDLLDNPTADAENQTSTTNTGVGDFEPNVAGYSYGSAPDTGDEKSGSTNVDNQLNENSVQDKELSVEDQKSIEDELSDPDNGITARVIQSLDTYIKIKFFKDNKPYAIYKSRNFSVEDAKNFLKEQN